MQMLPLEPAVVKLSGEIQRETFPGHPNYQSIEQGDRPEAYWIMHLSEPVQVDDGNVPIDRIQLVVTGPQQFEGRYTVSTGDLQQRINQMASVYKDAHQQARTGYSNYEHLLGKRVIVTGTLFRSHTIHHKTDVLITVEDIVEV